MEKTTYHPPPCATAIMTIVSLAGLTSVSYGTIQKNTDIERTPDHPPPQSKAIDTGPALYSTDLNGIIGYDTIILGDTAKATLGTTAPALNEQAATFKPLGARERASPDYSVIGYAILEGIDEHRIGFDQLE